MIWFFIYTASNLGSLMKQKTVNPITAENTVKHDIIKVKKDGPMEIGP